MKKDTNKVYDKLFLENKKLEEKMFKSFKEKINDTRLLAFASFLGMNTDCTSSDPNITKTLGICRNVDSISIIRVIKEDNPENIINEEKIRFTPFTISLDFGKDKAKEKDEEKITKKHQDNMIAILGEKYEKALKKYNENLEMMKIYLKENK